MFSRTMRLGVTPLGCHHEDELTKTFDVRCQIRKTKAPANKVNAAPSVDAEEAAVADKKPDLLNALKAQFLPPKTKSDDYQNFVKEMGL